MWVYQAKGREHFQDFFDNFPFRHLFYMHHMPVIKKQNNLTAILQVQEVYLDAKFATGHILAWSKTN